MALASELWPKWVFREKRPQTLHLVKMALLPGLLRRARVFLFILGD
jgi:hypothetical protein